MSSTYMERHGIDYEIGERARKAAWWQRQKTAPVRWHRLANGVYQSHCRRFSIAKSHDNNLWMVMSSTMYYPCHRLREAQEAAAVMAASRKVEAERLPTPQSYDVTFEYWDTRIREYDDDEHDWETFEDAKEDALDYLRDMIESCQARVEEIERVRTFEEYARN